MLCLRAGPVELGEGLPKHRPRCGSLLMRISRALRSPNCDPPDTTLWVRTAAASATLTVKACHGSFTSERAAADFGDQLGRSQFSQAIWSIRANSRSLSVTRA